MSRAVLVTGARVPPRAIVLDTETTGFSPASGDRIVEIGGVELIEGQPSGREFHAYINPRRDVPWGAARVHGLTTEFLADKPAFEDVVGDWLDFVGDTTTPLWAHNAPFDERFLRAELERAGHPPCPPVSCSLVLARTVLGAGKFSLETLAMRAGANYTGRGAHSALADARVLAQVLHDLLWPAETAMGVPDKSATPSRIISTTYAEPQLRPDRLDSLLPPGFSALTPAMDPRIRRYDDTDVPGPLPAKGKRWTPEEDERLVRGFLRESRNILELVQDHGRSPAALLLRLDRLGIIKVGELFQSMQ